MRRKNNQDAHVEFPAADVESWRHHGHVFMVADGMGAHAAGELASKLAVDRVPHLYRKLRDQYSPPEALERSLIETNSEIHRRGMANRDFENMGTTASVLILVPQGAILAQIGDSRIYRLRRGQLEQLTFDHSLVWELRAAGQIPKDGEFSRMVPKNIITRSLGPQATVQVDMEGPFPLEHGDTFLLCSDGLTGQIADEELGPILANLPPHEAAQVLIDLANLRGGPDNITVIVIRVTDNGIDSSEAGGTPIRVGADPRPKRIPLAVWILMSVFVLAALVFVVLSKFTEATIAAVVAALSILGGMLYKMGSEFRGVPLRDGRKLGKAPYTTLICSTLHDFLSKLAKIVSELDQAARENDWSIDRQPFERFCALAEQSVKDQKDEAALRAYARAISSMMHELRNCKSIAKDSDSAID
jgi:protein phosphatase